MNITSGETEVPRDGEVANHKQMRKAVLTLAMPATTQMFFQALAGVITQMVVGHLSAADLAGVGLANRITFILIAVLSSLTVGCTTLIARNIGAGNPKAANHILAQSLSVGLVGGALFGLTGVLCSRYLMLFLVLGKGEPAVIDAGVLYLRVVFASMILNLPMLFVNGALQGAGDAKTPMFLTMGMNAVEVVLSYPLTYGLGPIAGHGLLGACLAQGIARGMGGLLAVWTIVKPGARLLRLTRDLNYRPDWSTLRQILHIGLPASGEQLVRQSSQIIYTMFVAGLGTIAIAANQLVMTVQSLANIPGFGFGVAATTLVGQALGAKDTAGAKQYGWQTAHYAAILMSVTGAAFFIFARPLASMFTTDLAVRDLTAYCLRITAFCQVPFSFIMVLYGGLRGAGDTKWVMYMTGAGQWGIRLVFSFVFGLWMGWGLPGVWAAMLLDVMIRACFVIARFESGRWQTVLEATPPGHLSKVV